MYIKINGLVERVLIQLFDNGYRFEECIRSSTELMATDFKTVEFPRKETSYYVSCEVKSIETFDSSDAIRINLFNGKSFVLSKYAYDKIEIV